MLKSTDLLTIGELARRSGVATSALRFYEEKGLIRSTRTEGNQRRFARETLRRVAIIRAAQTLGITLAEVGAALEPLPRGRTPTWRDWQRMSRLWREDLDARIAALERIRDQLSSCIGCGCLSIGNCALFNPGDRVASRGPGPRYLMGDPRTAEPNG